MHLGHPADVEITGPDTAKGIWAFTDRMFFPAGGDISRLTSYGFYHETYVRGHDGQWRFSYRKLERTHAETSPGASIMAADFSGENLRVGVAD